MIRRSLLAGAVAMLVVPALAGCEAGFNAPTLSFHNAGGGTYWPTPGTTDTAAASGIRISNAFVLAAPSDSSLPAGSQAGLFLGLFNAGDNSDQLVKVTTSAATSVSISGNSVTLPPNGAANLTGPQPEIVLNGLTQSLAGGQDISVTFDFSNAGEITLPVPVEPQSFSYSDLSQPPSATPTP